VTFIDLKSLVLIAVRVLSTLDSPHTFRREKQSLLLQRRYISLNSSRSVLRPHCPCVLSITYSILRRVVRFVVFSLTLMDLTKHTECYIEAQ
jgi:hypothetical protein